MPNFPTQHRNQRPPLLPTPTNMPPLARFSRNISMNSDSSKGQDDMESSEMDMELSDDDISGLEGNNMANGKPRKIILLENAFFLHFVTLLDFYQINQGLLGPPPQRYPPHQMNRPPPSIPHDNDPMNQSRKSWIHNNVGNSDLPQLDDIDLPDPMSIPPPNPNFMLQQPNNRGNFRGSPGNFRGHMRGGQMMRGALNNSPNNGNNSSPYMNNFKGRGRGRGFRGGNNFRGQW